MNMILGRKSGMTRIFQEDGSSIPVTVIEVNPNRVVMVKTKEGKDGYNAVQVTAGQVKEKKLTKSEKGHFAAAKVEPGCKVLEFPVKDTSNYKVGDEIKADIFKEGNLVDVIATSRGKGFAGTIKRHNFRGQRQTHGNSLSHRVPGSIGQCQDPGKVFKGKKMAGHMGNRKVTVQSLEIIKIDQSKGVILIKGAVPGAPGSDVVVKSSVKKEGAA